MFTTNFTTNVVPNAGSTSNAADSDDAALTAMAMHLKANSKISLSVDELKALGMPRLTELKGKLKPAAIAGNSSDDWGSYDLNNPEGI